MPKNQLFYGDNLDVLRRHISDQSVDLVYLDRPSTGAATNNAGAPPYAVFVGWER